jgi:amidase
VECSVSALQALGATVVGEVSQYFDEAFDITVRYWKRKENALPRDDAERHLVDWDRYRTRMLVAHDGVDTVVMPATASVAPPHRAMTAEDYIFTMPASLTGAPAVVVPVAEDDGLPIAVQVVAARWRDHVALRVAGALE